MRSRRCAFLRAESAPDITRGVDLLAAVVVVKRDGRPLLVPRSGPHLEEWNVLVFTTSGLYRESMKRGLLRAARLPGISASSRTAAAIGWAELNGHGVMLDPLIEEGRVVCRALANALLVRSAGGAGVG